MSNQLTIEFGSLLDFQTWTLLDRWFVLGALKKLKSRPTTTLIEYPKTEDPSKVSYYFDFYNRNFYISLDR